MQMTLIPRMSLHCKLPRRRIWPIKSIGIICRRIIGQNKTHELAQVVQKRHILSLYGAGVLITLEH